MEVEKEIHEKVFIFYIKLLFCCDPSNKEEFIENDDMMFSILCVGIACLCVYVV